MKNISGMAIFFYFSRMKNLYWTLYLVYYVGTTNYFVLNFQTSDPLTNFNVD